MLDPRKPPQSLLSVWLELLCPLSPWQVYGSLGATSKRAAAHFQLGVFHASHIRNRGFCSSLTSVAVLLDAAEEVCMSL